MKDYGYHLFRQTLGGKIKSRKGNSLTVLLKSSILNYINKKIITMELIVHKVTNSYLFNKLMLK
jgi:hypothetical protein